jgi:AraC family transcriptional regulator
MEPVAPGSPSIAPHQADNLSADHLTADNLTADNLTADGLHVAETHGIALFPQNRLLMHSEGLGWRNVYASLAVESPWQATLPAVDHYCIAYCVGHSARISRALDGERTRSAELKPRLFGVVPPNMRSQWDLRGSPEILLIYLRAQLIEQTAAQVFNRAPGSIDIPPGLGFADGLLEQLALAVLGELRKGEHSNAIYVDTLVNYPRRD